MMYSGRLEVNVSDDLVLIVDVAVDERGLVTACEAWTEKVGGVPKYRMPVTAASTPSTAAGWSERTGVGVIQVAPPSERWNLVLGPHALLEVERWKWLRFDDDVAWIGSDGVVRYMRVTNVMMRMETHPSVALVSRSLPGERLMMTPPRYAVATPGGADRLLVSEAMWEIVAKRERGDAR